MAPLGPVFSRLLNPRRSQARQRVAAHWADPARHVGTPQRPRNWLSSRHVLTDYVFAAYFGGVDWYRYLRTRYCTPPRRLALSLCCGNGQTERDFSRRGLCVNFDGLDLSPGAIQAAQRAAQAFDGLFIYRVADIEQITLPEARYDLVIGWMALHHLEDLDRVFDEVARTLQPGGIFVVNEYVGPPRFAVTENQERLVNEWLTALPEELRREPSGEIRDRFVPPTAREVVTVDPSEAVCSDQLLPALAEHFTLLERIDYGGPLVHWALRDILQNFDPENRAHRGHLSRLYHLERDALRTGQVHSDFSFVVAVPPSR